MVIKDDEIVDDFEEIIEDQGQKLNIPKELPVLMLRDIVVFPYGGSLICRERKIEKCH